MKLFAAKQIVYDLGCTEKLAKAAIAHCHPVSGQCVECGYSRLEGEKVTCPKCQAFNYNLTNPGFDKELSSHPEWTLHFCSHLEWSLDFEDLDDKAVNGFWCDGVAAFSTDQILELKEVHTKAWIGKDGQDIYKMRIKFGEQSLRNYSEGLSVINCIPKSPGRNWIKIDAHSRQIEIELL